MAILQTEPDRKEILVGAYVSRKVNDYFTLYTLAVGKSKSKVFTELFYDFISRQKIVDSETDLLKKIIVRVQKTRSKTKNREMDIEMFKSAIETELTKKGVAEKYIAVILSEII